MAEDNIKAQMRKGILEYCILAILSREDSYAPKIIAELKEAEMIVVEGTLYPILTRQKNAPSGVTILGGKTGTTDQAGSCLALLSQNSYGEPYISIVMNAPSKSVLYEDMNQLLSRING